MKCRICDGEQVWLSNSKLDMLCPDDYPLHGDLQIGICHDCSFVANVGSATEKDYENYYLTINKHHTRSVIDTAIDEVYFQTICDFLIQECKFEFSSSEICDFGSGALTFSNVVSRLGARCVSYGIGDDVSKFADKDLVLSTHTFEHIFDLKQSTKNLLEIVKPGGLILIAVPDFSAYQKFPYGPFNQFDLEHINHFEESSLRTLMELTGVEFVSSRKSHREVRPGLSYSEILVVGRRVDSINQPFEKNTNVGETTLKLLDLFLQNKFQWDAIEKQIDATYSVHSDSVHYCIYGLSSFAFRVLNYIDKKGYGIDTYADSDKRLSKYGFGGNSIINKEQFLKIANQCLRNNKTLVVFVAAIGSRSIVAMLEKMRISNLNIVNLYDFYKGENNV